MLARTGVLDPVRAGRVVFQGRELALRGKQGGGASRPVGAAIGRVYGMAGAAHQRREDTVGRRRMGEEHEAALSLLFNDLAVLADAGFDQGPGHRERRIPGGMVQDVVVEFALCQHEFVLGLCGTQGAGLRSHRHVVRHFGVVRRNSDTRRQQLCQPGDDSFLGDGQRGADRMRVDDHQEPPPERRIRPVGARVSLALGEGADEAIGAVPRAEVPAVVAGVGAGDPMGDKLVRTERMKLGLCPRLLGACFAGLVVTQN